MEKTRVVNLYAGPGAGKSTTAAHLFAKLKHKDINCELVTEYAKEKAWEGTLPIVGQDQVYIFAKQQRAMRRLLGKVDYIITDSPIILGMYYGRNQSKALNDLILETYHSMDNVDIFLKREKLYQPAGREQTEDQARSIDKEIYALLIKHNIPFWSVPANDQAADVVMGLI